MDGWSCDRWEAQWQLSCTITAIFYGRRIDKEDRKGIYSVIFIMRPRVRACKLGIFRSFSLVFVLIP